MDSKKFFNRDNLGLSTVTVAALVLIIMVVVLAAVASLYINNATPYSSSKISSLITIEYNNGEIDIIMNYGDPIKNAFKNNSWCNLEVKINGILVDTSNVTCSTADDFFAGSKITINKSLNIGDTVSVIYKPANQLLREYTYS